MKMVWRRSRHDAGVGGTDVLRDLLGGRAFSFPKSVYAVYDCLASVLRGRKDALIMDFFAGSGTTLHGCQREIAACSAKRGIWGRMPCNNRNIASLLKGARTNDHQILRQP